MKITTDSGKTFDANWAWGPVGARRRVLASLRDGRALSQIAVDLEGAESLTCAEENSAEAVYQGFTRLVRIERTDDGCVEIALEKET